jgi:S-formylglutathione hydrolase FrmB
MYLRAAVILPRDFEREPSRRYPLRVHIGGYGTRYTNAGLMMSPNAFFRRAWVAEGTPQMLLLHLDGAGPFGDPYQVNSANNGPYGDALTQELIPYVESKFRGIGAGYARVTDGASTGGWVSFALQVFYPDFFNGCWSHSPDPVDFRAYELIDIYEDVNAYVNERGFERPSAREISGDVRYTVRHECQLEVVLGRGDRWWLSGKDWCAWNAVFGPRGADGLPKPLWDGRTGALDHSVVEHWKKYDLRRVLEENWSTLAPKLKGKIHIWVGDADDYFLNNAVHLLDDSLKDLQPPFEGTITYGQRGGHGFRVLSERQLLAAMAAAIERGKR